MSLPLMVYFFILFFCCWVFIDNDWTKRGGGLSAKRKKRFEESMSFSNVSLLVINIRRNQFMIKFETLLLSRTYLSFLSLWGKSELQMKASREWRWIYFCVFFSIIYRVFVVLLGSHVVSWSLCLLFYMFPY